MRPEVSSRSILVRAVVVLLASCCVAVASEVFEPHERIAASKPKIELAKQVPTRFGDWEVDDRVIPILPSPELQEKINSMYNETLARTYRNAEGVQVMLTIAYGSDQSSDATQVHRPEFCYSAQGFRIRDRGLASISLNDARKLSVRRLVGEQGPRYEPISYWVTIDESVTLPGVQRKLEQLRFGLKGQIPDGMLVRVSTVGLKDAQAYAIQDDFVRQLASHMPAQVYSRYFGA